MAHPINAVRSIELIPGEIYYGFSNSAYEGGHNSYLRATFTEYWTNGAGYLMARFHSGSYNMPSLGISTPIQERGDFPNGSSFRIWDDNAGPSIAYMFYKACRFTSKEKAELKTRLRLRQRRQYERGLTGSTPDGKSFPRDLVREIALRYLTDDRVGHVGQWKVFPRPPLDYTKLGFRAHDNEMLQDAEQAITKADKWEWMKKVDPGRWGYAGCEAPEFREITRCMKYQGHSGSTFGCTFRTMQYLAKVGREEFREDYAPTA